MGIRIKKTLGYGLCDVKSENGIITDPRFNQEWSDNLWEWEGKNIEGFFEFAKAEDEKREWGLGLHLFPDASFIGGGKPYLYDFLTYDSEYGLENVIVLTPITGREWKRFDDMIDYYEEPTKGYRSCDPHFEVLDVPLYPYDAYINNETGEIADETVREMIYQIRNSTIDLKTEKNEKKIDAYHYIIELALKKLDCEMHWTEKWNVMIPEEIQDYCRYMNMFTNESHMWKLQPMIYTYWS